MPASQTAGTQDAQAGTSFVAVSAAPAADESAPSVALHRAPRSLPQRLRDRAVAATARSRELFALIAAAATLLLASGVGAHAGLAPTAWRATAAACGVALGLAMLGLRRLPRPSLPQPLRRRVAWIVSAQLLVLGSAPWWQALMQDGHVPIVLACVALAGAALLAPLGPLALAVSALPLGAALATLARTGDHGPLPGAACASLLAAGLAIVLRRQWDMTMGLALEQQQRIRDVEAERDAAIKADQEKSRFLAIASHDLRQPVHAIGLFAATLDKRLEGSAEQPLVRNLNRAIAGLDRSFNVMLDISRLDAGAVEPRIQHFPLRDLFRRLHMHYAGQAEQKGLGLRFSPGGKSISSDPQLLERVLGNLLQNAIRYTATGGIVVVARSTATHVHVEVWDSGVGIAARDLRKVFDEFYQVGGGQRVRSQGLGMGLAIVKRLVRLLGHELIVASRPGRGTMFRLRIARGGLDAIEQVTAAADTLPMGPLQPRTVLVLDDEETIRDGLCMLLREWGYDALSAGTIAEARQAARQLDAPPDLILSDLHLGDGPDGIAAIELIRRECGCDVAAMLITGDTTAGEMRRATESGHTVLFKPVQPRKLYDALRALGS